MTIPVEPIISKFEALFTNFIKCLSEALLRRFWGAFEAPFEALFISQHERFGWNYISWWNDIEWWVINICPWCNIICHKWKVLSKKFLHARVYKHNHHHYLHPKHQCPQPQYQYHHLWRVGHNKACAPCAPLGHIVGHKVGHILSCLSRWIK